MPVSTKSVVAFHGEMSRMLRTRVEPPETGVRCTTGSRGRGRVPDEGVEIDCTILFMKPRGVNEW